MCACGHPELAQGRSGRAVLAEAQESAHAIKAVAGSELGQAVSKLHRAVVAVESGQRLFRGECLEDIPEDLRRFLAKAGDLRGALG